MQYFGFDRSSFSLKTFGFGNNEFSPLELFAGGKQGVWYDPSDLSTLFQDAAGTTPVTKDGDPVGLMLDKSKGLKLGPELFGNGDFSNSLTDWALVASTSVTASVLEGVCVIDMHSSIVGLAIGIQVNQPVEVGKTYILTADISHTGRVDFSAGLYCFDGAFSSKPITNSAGRASIIFTATSTSVQIRAGINATTAGVSGEKATIDNISMRELKGNHCRQLTSSARPMYKTDGSLRWLQFDGVDDSLKSNLYERIIPNTVFIAVSRLTRKSVFFLDAGSVTNSSALTVMPDSTIRAYSHSAGILDEIAQVPVAIPVVSGAVFGGSASAVLLNNNIKTGVLPLIGSSGITLAATAGGIPEYRLQGSIYGVVAINADIISNQQVKEYLAAKSGVVL